MRFLNGTRAALLAATVSALPLLGHGAVAQEAVRGQGPNAVVLGSDSQLDRLLLPYSPILFDVVVMVGRSFAEITYTSRSYDPLTESFSVSGLHIRRDSFDLSVDRVRADPDSTLMQGLSLNTAPLDLPPPVRAGLDRLGLQTVRGDVALDYQRNDARAAYALELAMDFPDIGSLQARAVVDGFHVLVPLEGIDYEAPNPEEPVPFDQPTPASPPPKITGTLRGFTATYRDAGLLDAVFSVAAEAQGVTAEQMAAGIGAMATMNVGPTLDSLPSGASPALRERAQDWARAAESFFQQQNSIRVTLDPLEPVPLERFQAGIIDEPLILALNPSVESPAPPAFTPAAVDATSDPLGAASALLGGRGVLQDREGAARSLLGLAAGGNVQAVEAIAAGFGNDPAPELSPAELGRLLQFLLVARAGGAPVSDLALTRIEERLPPEGRRQAEVAAGEYFRANTPEGRAAVAVSVENVASYTPSALRALAFDAYDGVNSSPRNRTEAYALALVASAAGDRVAETLRDDLAAAARGGRIALSIDEARTRAAPLWEAYARGAAQQPATP